MWEKKEIATDHLDAFSVFTVAKPSLEKPYQTRISARGFNHWNQIPVEYYQTRDDATLGHQKWISYMYENPNFLLDADTEIRIRRE